MECDRSGLIWICKVVDETAQMRACKKGKGKNKRRTEIRKGSKKEGRKIRGWKAKKIIKLTKDGQNNQPTSQWMCK